MCSVCISSSPSADLISASTIQWKDWEGTLPLPLGQIVGGGCVRKEEGMFVRGGPSKGSPQICPLFQKILVLQAVTRDRGQGTEIQRGRHRLLRQRPQFHPSALALWVQRQRSSIPDHHYHLHHQQHPYHHNPLRLFPHWLVPLCPHSCRHQVKCLMCQTKIFDTDLCHPWLGPHHLLLHQAMAKVLGEYGQMMREWCILIDWQTGWSNHCWNNDTKRMIENDLCFWYGYWLCAFVSNYWPPPLSFIQ